MEPQQYRSIILHMAKAGKKAKEIFENLYQVHGKDAPSLATVKRWVNEAKWGREDVKTRGGSGRPPEAITQAKLDAARKLVESDPKISRRQLSIHLKLAHDTINRLMNSCLGFEKKLARWVPHELSDAQKRTRIDCASQLLQSWGNRWSRFRSKLITVDETYVSLDTPNTRLSGGEWRPIGQEPADLARLPVNRRKVMAVVFWDAEGIVHIGWFKSTLQQRGLNGELYEEMLREMHKKLSLTAPAKIARGLLLLQDNAPCHRAPCVKLALRELDIKTVEHPPYSPDLAPSDYYLFRVLKNSLQGKKFTTEESLQEEVERYLRAKPESFYREGIDKLKTRLEAVLERRGSYLND